MQNRLLGLRDLRHSGIFIVNFNIFHIFFWCFYCSISAGEYLLVWNHALGKNRFKVNNKKIEQRVQGLQVFGFYVINVND